jgi:hypothetical protein
LLPATSVRKLPTAQMSLGLEPAPAPRLLLFLPSSGLGTTFQPPELAVLVV